MRFTSRHPPAEPAEKPAVDLAAQDLLLSYLPLS